MQTVSIAIKNKVCYFKKGYKITKKIPIFPLSERVWQRKKQRRT